MTRILHDDLYNNAIKLIKKYIYIYLQSKIDLFVFLILVIERVSMSLQPVSD